nr:ScyD/ScyE family protein [Arthrobacter sp. zg-Y750]
MPLFPAPSPPKETLVKSSSSAAAVLAAAALLALGASPAAAGGYGPRPPQPPDPPAAGEVTTVAENLLSPLSFAVSRGGAIDVAQSFAGVLTRIAPDGSTETLDAVGGGYGSAGVSRIHGRTYYTMGIGADTEDPAQNISLLKSVDRDGNVETLANIASHEYAENPDAVNTYGFEGLDAACAAQLPPEVRTARPGRTDSNPYATVPTRDGIVVSDSGMNALVLVDWDGDISTLAVLPAIPVTITAPMAEANGLPECTVGLTYNTEPVPTDVERGPDGMLYVASLPGAPEGFPTGSVFRVDPRSGEMEVVATGFSGATGLAVAPDGDIYVAELFANRISVIPAGSDTPEPFYEVNQPGALELRGSTLYASVDVLPPGGPQEPGEPPAEPPVPEAPPAGRIIGVEVVHAGCGGADGHGGNSGSGLPYSTQDEED